MSARDEPARAAAIVEHDLPAGRFRKFLGDDASRQIEPAPVERHQHAHRGEAGCRSAYTIDPRSQSKDGASARV